MRRNAFTLAEVLITLTIIGVIAAITAPSLIGSYQKSKVGPMMRKFINTIEVANQHLFSDNSADKLSYIYNQDRESYLNALSTYVLGNTSEDSLADIEIVPKKYDKTTNLDSSSAYLIYNMKSGEDFAINVVTAADLNSSKATAQGSYKGRWATLYYDMNGFSNSPNILGKDIFYFKMDDNGTLIPDGGKLQYTAYYSKGVTEQWSGTGGYTPNQCNETKVHSGSSCAGSIMDNNWKVIYKY